MESAWRRFVKDEEQNPENARKEARRYLNFLIQNFTRITERNDEEYIQQLTDYLFICFQNFAESELGKKLRQTKEKLTINTLYQMYLAITDMSPCENLNVTARDLIGLPAFSDIVHGCFSQKINNAFNESQHISYGADHKLLIQPEGAVGIFSASKIIEARSFDEWLLSIFSFENLEKEGLQNCIEKFKIELNTHRIHGLGSALLLRHILGESADLGPDNMLLKPTDSGSYQLLNIDVTGFRFQRDVEFLDKNTNTIRLGWIKTLLAETPEDILSRLFDKSVFNANSDLKIKH